MTSLITINDIQIEQLTYHDQPVVTFDMIATVHGIPVSNVQKSFQRHQNRFTEGKHVYRIDHEEASQNGLRVLSNHIGARLFTEKGYLLLVKPMKDEQSWQVQERMIDEYFVMQHTLHSNLPNSVTSPWDILAQHVALGKAQEQKMLALEAAQDAHKDLLIANQLDTIQAQQTALTAQDMALTALRGQAWMSIRQYVYIYDLEPQFPPKAQKAYALHLGDYSRDHGIPMYKAATADVLWPDERTYHVQAIADTLPGWLARNGSQIILVPRTQETATP